MGKLNIIIIGLINSIFDTQLADLISRSSVSNLLVFQLQFHKLNSEVIAYVNRLSNANISICQYQNDKCLYSLKFSTSDVDQPQYAKNLEIVLSPIWDGFNIYEVFKNTKTLLYEYKV